MSVLSPLTGEMSDSKVAAIFHDSARAHAVATQLREQLALQAAQVQVVTPHDRHPGKKLEPESHGIFRTLMIAHYKLGIVGLMAGVLLYVVLRGLGIPAITSSPGLSAIVILAFCAFFGSMLGGLVTLRPDHAPYVDKVLSALKDGDFAVVVHALDEAQRDRAAAVFKRMHADPVTTL